MGNKWIEISIHTTTVTGDLLSDFLVESGAKGVILGDWKPEDVSENTIVKAYFTEGKDVESLIQEIINKLEIYSNSGLNCGSKEILSKIVDEESWENSWKDYFHTFKIGKSIVIKPSWEEYKQSDGERIVNFDPGMAFGTGSHPSTFLCIEEIENLSNSIKNKETINILDLGTGSGILSIVLKLCGFKNITAVDNDPVAYRTSKENFLLNNCQINLFQGEIKDCAEEYDLIFGNLLSEIIIGISDEIFLKTKKNGLFVGSGIIKQKEGDVINSLTKSGFIFKDKKYMENWVMIVFSKP